MRAIPMIVLEVGTYQSDKMALPEDNNVLEQLAPAAADPAFSHRILPRATISRSGGLRPVASESVSIPLGNGVRIYDGQPTRPARP